MANARQIALEALIKVGEDDGFSNIVLDSLLKKSDLSGKDNALATALFYGTIEKKITLDYIIKKFSEKNQKRIKKLVKINLRMALYQILFLEKIPESAAVNEALKLLEQNKCFYAKGFTNALLRNVIRSKPIDLAFSEIEDEIERLSVKTSFPIELIIFFKKSYDIDVKEILEGLSALPKTAVRVNTLKTNAEKLKTILESEGIKATSGRIENSLIINGYGSLKKLKSFNEGLFHVQDESSQLAAKSLSPNRGERILDVCAAPGGKTFTIAQLMQNDGEIIANDLYSKRLKLIEEGAKRLSVKIIKTTENDASKDLRLGEFDRILCDVPCSGLGVIKKKPEIKYKSIDSLDILPKLQYLILCKVVSNLKMGGTIVYSTCTLNPQENEDVVSRFLREHPNFSHFSIENEAFCKADHGQKTFFPTKDGTDGFFISVLKKDS